MLSMPTHPADTFLGAYTRFFSRSDLSPKEAMAGGDALADRILNMSPSARPLLGKRPQSMRTGGAGRVKAISFMFISDIITLALGLDQCYKDWKFVNGDFKQFLLADKLVACCKLYIIGYFALYTTGSEMFGIVCLLVCCLRCFIIAYHLKRNYTTWIKFRITGMIIAFGTGVALLFYGMVVPKDNALYTIVFPVYTIVIVLIDGVVLLVRAQEKKTGDNEHAIHDLVLKLVEITISIIRLVDFKVHTHKHWDAEKILRLVGSSLPVLIGICLICFMLYNVRTLFPSKLIKWRGKIARVFAVDQDGDVQGQAAEEGTVDVEMAVMY